MIARALLMIQAPRILCLLLALLLSASATAKTLVLAQISDRPKKDFRQLRPMAEHIQGQLEHLGYDRAEVKLFPDLTALKTAIREKQVHWISETALTSARLVQAGLANPVALKWKRGQSEYRSLIYVRHDSGIDTLSDLKGRRIAFEHPDSFSSYYLPAIALRQAGLELQALEHPGDPVDPERVGYLFSRNERNNLLWVEKGITVAGSLNDGDWTYPGRLPDAPKNNMKMLYRSKLYPRAYELVTPALPAKDQEALRHALLSLDPELHASLLSRYEETERLTPITPEQRALLLDLDLEWLP